MGRPNAPQVEKVAAEILRNCLIGDGSLLTPDVPIWTLDNLAELRRVYVDAPDVSAKSFSEKLSIQLSTATPGARQLFAEIYILNVLPVVNFRSATKAGFIEEVLAPLQSPVTLTPDVQRGFDEGVFNGGPAWNNRRWAQLSFLIEFAEHFKQQGGDTRASAATDPEVLRTVVKESPGHREPAQRQALLYLFQPRNFPPIVSEQHRRLLRDGLSKYLPDEPTGDLDEDIRSIIDRVEAESGGPVDFYDDTWRSRWLDKADPHPGGGGTEGGGGDGEARPFSVADIITDGCFHSKERLQEILDHWRDKRNLVLQGAPGTGKTWLAKRLAQALIGSQAPDAIRSVQFHPNTSYEDFVRGWRPTSGGQLVLTDGVLIQHAERARESADIPHVLIIEEINRGNPAQAFGEMLTLIEGSKRNPSDALMLSYPRSDDEQFYLPDNLYILGTMNIADRSLALVDFALRRRFAFETLDPALTDSWAAHLRKKLGNDTSLVEKIRLRISELNQQISEDPMLGAHFAIGHSYVTPTDSQSNGTSWYNGVVDTQIAPLLAEYWFDDRAKADAAVAALKL